MKKDETTGAEYPSKSDSNFCNSQLMPKILPDDEIVEGINSLNLTKRKVFDVVHTWVNKNYVNCDGHDVEPVHIFLSSSGGTSKSHFLKVIFNAISETLVYNCKDPKKPTVLLRGPTGISTVNMVGITIHSGLGIEPEQSCIILVTDLKLCKEISC